MALRGTLADFSLPDILQLVGYQQKTGMLLLKDRQNEVTIYFVDGNVVKAEQSSRDPGGEKYFLGNIMARAGVITEEQLASARTAEQRTLRRFGDILVESGACDRATLKEITRLHTTETIHRLFMWRSGTYEFTKTPVDYDEQSYEPIRAENLLMEGFRMVDEWPAVRRVIPSARCTFLVLKDLPKDVPRATNGDDILAGMAEAMGLDPSDSDDNEGTDGGKRKISQAERSVFALVAPHGHDGSRTVQDIVDISRLGEFETSKALASLTRHGNLRVVRPLVEEEADSEPFTMRRLLDSAAPVLTRLALYALVAAAVGGLVRLGTTRGLGVLAIEGGAFVHGAPLTDKTGELMGVRLTQAIETFRLLEGRYPDALEELLTPVLGLEPRDLSFPFQTNYAYRRVQKQDGSDGYALALPLR